MTILRDFVCPLHGYVCSAPATATVSCGQCSDPGWLGEKPGLEMARLGGQKRTTRASKAAEEVETGDGSSCASCGGEVLTARWRVGRPKLYCTDACGRAARRAA